MGNIKIIRVLFRLNKNILFNSFKKNATWVKILTAAAIIYIFLNAFISGGMLALLFKSKIHPGDKNFIPVLNTILFLLFISNILASLFINSSDYSSNISSKLIYYPITLRKIVLLEIGAGIFEFFNLLFVPFYFAAFFTAGGFDSAGRFFMSVFILILFVFSISGIIMLVRNIYLFIIKNKKLKRVFLYLSIVLLFALNFLIRFFHNSHNIFLLSSFTGWLPSGIFAKYVSQGHSREFFITSALYFFIFLFLISEVNLHILRIINTAAKPGHEKSSKHEQNFITKLVDRYVSNPIIKKELHYTFRSPRELLNYGVIIYFYIYTAWMVLSDGVSKLGLHHVLLIMQMFFLFMHILIILQYCGNFFRYDYEGVINYFYRPISYSYLIRSKTFPFNIILIFNILFALIMLIITGIKPAGFLLFISLIIILYHSGSAAGTLLSIYFPKRVNLYGLTGSNVTFWSFIITLLSASILIGLCYPMIKDFSGVFKIFVSIILLIFSLKIYYSQERINSIFAKILIKRKERIINICR